MIYTSLIESKLTYGLLLWDVDLNDVLIVQKKAMRTITLSLLYSHTEPLFKKLTILNIKICIS